jgi:hypothetical protein
VLESVKEKKCLFLLSNSCNCLFNSSGIYCCFAKYQTIRVCQLFPFLAANTYIACTVIVFLRTMDMQHIVLAMMQRL